MATDASIPLGMQPVNPMQNLSSLMGIAAQRQAISSSQTAQQGQQISNDNAGISLRERQALQPILSNPKAWTDPTTGDLDLNKLGPMVMQAAPTTGGDVIRTMIGVQQDRTNAKRLISTQTDENNTRVGSALASLPSDASSDDIDKTFGVIKSMYPNPDMQNVLTSMQGKLQKVLTHSTDPEQRQFAIQQAARMFLPQPTQQEMASPTLAFPQTQAGIQPFNTKAGVPGIPIGPTGAAMTPPNQVVPTTGGGIAVANPTTGQVGGFGGQPAPQVDLPAGETKDTQAELQAQRTAAQQAANSAPVMHNLNRGVIAEVDKGITTGKLGEIIQRVKSATGFAGDTGTDYNTLGKLLERSALTSAQAMGPHTNAGLEAQVRANGSTDYSPGAIRKIAALNDAATTGASMYQSGLESAISKSGGSVFAKRQFDQQWASAMNPSNGVDGVQVLRFKNAVDSGDQTEKAAILKEVGGPGSKGAQALLSKLRSLQQLSVQQ